MRRIEKYPTVDSVLELGLTVDSQEFFAVARVHGGFDVACTMPPALMRLALQALIGELGAHYPRDEVRRWVARALDRALPPGGDAPWQ